jgi:type VI secretion system VasD/TssJ family lipoprotein
MQWMVCVLLGLLAISCSRSPQDASGGFEPGAVTIKVQPDDTRLNFFQGEPHALNMCVYQLSDPNAFNMLSKNEEGITKLLGCSDFDPSVASVKTIVVQPAVDEIHVHDRAMGAKYIGVVAGFWERSDLDQVVKLYTIPEGEVKVGGFFSFKKQKVTLPLYMEFYLGPDHMKALRVNSGGK